MVTRNPLFYDSANSVHRPMDNGDVVPVSTIPVSATIGNRISALTDGLYTGDYYGTVLYVNTATGVDQVGNGTIGAPYKTIAYALSQVNSLFPGGRFQGENFTIALAANQTYPWTVDFTMYGGSITFTFYGDSTYGSFNSNPIGTGANPGEMAGLARPNITPTSSVVSGQNKLAGINRLGGSVRLYGVTVTLPAAPSNPSIANYGGFVDFIRSPIGAKPGDVNWDGTVFNMTDTNAYWGALGIHPRSGVTTLSQFGTQLRINNLLMNAANSPTTAQLTARQYFIKFIMDYAGNNQQQLNLSTNVLNSSTGSGTVIVNWSDTNALIVTGSATNQASFPIAFDLTYGLRNYVFNLINDQQSRPLNFLSSRQI